MPHKEGKFILGIGDVETVPSTHRCFGSPLEAPRLLFFLTGILTEPTTHKPPFDRLKDLKAPAPYALYSPAR